LSYFLGLHPLGLFYPCKGRAFNRNTPQASPILALPWVLVYDYRSAPLHKATTARPHALPEIPAAPRIRKNSPYFWITREHRCGISVSVAAAEIRYELTLVDVCCACKTVLCCLLFAKMCNTDNSTQCKGANDCFSFSFLLLKKPPDPDPNQCAVPRRLHAE